MHCCKLRICTAIAREVQVGVLHPQGIFIILKTNMLIRSELLENNITKPIHEKKAQL
jgi:hypothetical protein